MNILVGSVSDESSHYDFSFDEEGFGKLCGDKGRNFVIDKVTMWFCLFKVGDAIHLDGNIVVKATTECSKCLSLTDIDVTDSFNYVFVSEPAFVVNEEVELTADDMDYIYYTGDSLDIGAIVAEQVNLLVPMKSLCSDDCNGLCPKCGNNLNNSNCCCTVSTGRREFAVLKDFKVKK
ncbi:MAG: DUF177 domain-containing protein [Deltaproteobacteria bacterium]